MAGLAPSRPASSCRHPASGYRLQVPQHPHGYPPRRSSELLTSFYGGSISAQPSRASSQRIRKKTLPTRSVSFRESDLTGGDRSTRRHYILRQRSAGGSLRLHKAEYIRFTSAAAAAAAGTPTPLHRLRMHSAEHAPPSLSRQLSVRTPTPLSRQNSSRSAGVSTIAATPSPARRSTMGAARRTAPPNRSFSLSDPRPAASGGGGWRAGIVKVIRARSTCSPPRHNSRSLEHNSAQWMSQEQANIDICVIGATPVVSPCPSVSNVCDPGAQGVVATGVRQSNYPGSLRDRRRRFAINKGCTVDDSDFPTGGSAGVSIARLQVPPLEVGMDTQRCRSASPAARAKFLADRERLADSLPDRLAVPTIQIGPHGF